MTAWRLWLLAMAVASCHRSDDSAGAARPPGPVELVLKYQPLGDDPRPMRELLAGFERAHPGVTVRAELLPNASDLTHQFFLTALEGGDQSFDVLVADVIWIPSFARA